MRPPRPRPRASARPEHRRDPLRWRALPRGASESAKQLARDVQLMPHPIDLDDLRLAQIRQRVLQRAAGVPRKPFLPWGWTWLRTAAIALGFMLLGGLTTALAARVYIRRLEPSVTTVPRSADVIRDKHPRGQARRWRMAVRQAAEVDVSLGPDSAEIAVVDGRAEITGPQIAGNLTLTPGRSWMPDAPASVASLTVDDRQPTTPPSAAVAPKAAVALDAIADRPLRLALAPRAPSARAWAPTAMPKDSESSRPSLALPPAVSPSPSSIEPPPLASSPTEYNVRSRAPSEIKLSARATHAPTTSSEGPAEAFLVAGALRSLRSDHAPLDALAKLDEHDRRFPSGALRREGALARVEALLGLGRHEEALIVLESLTLAPVGTDRKVRLARGELRADRGRCASAIEDLSAILEGSATNDDIAARALHGRARCQLRLHNTSAARMDLREYLVRFPTGSHTTEVKGWLRRIGD